MSEHADSLRRMIDAFNANDRDALRLCLHPEIIVRRPLPDVGVASRSSDLSTYKGRDEVVPALNRLIDRAGGIQVDVRRLEEVGDDEVVFEFLARIGPPDERTTWLGWSLFGFRDGLVASTETFGTEAEARAVIAQRPAGN